MKRGIWMQLLSVAAFAWALPVHAQQPAPPDSRIADLARAGKIRIGVFPSFQYSKDSVTGAPRGLAIGIARTLAGRLGFSAVITVEHPSPPNVIECVKTGGCDLGFMLIDPARAADVDFTTAFVKSDFTYLMTASSSIRSASEVDQPGIRIAAVRGHASTAALLRVVKQASPVYSDTYEAAVDLLHTSKADAFASIREMLLQYSVLLPGSRVLQDSYQSNLAGVAVPKGNAGRLGYMNELLADMKRSGALQRLVDDAGLRGVELVAAN